MEQRKRAANRILALLTAAVLSAALFSSCAQSGTPTDSDPSSPVPVSSVSSTDTTNSGSQSKETDGTQSPATPEPTVIFKVALNKNDECFEILSENPAEVPRGGEARFVIRMKNDWVVERLVRQNAELDAQIISESDGTTTLILRNVRYAFIFSVECITAQTYVSYDPNGGFYLDGGDASAPYTVGYSMRCRLRPNSEIGSDRIARDGYVLIGWNTEPDGSGEHTGLGSRVTVEKGKTLRLFAEWAKESPTEDFTFRKYGKGYTVTGYNGNEKTVVVPSRYQDSPVDILAGGAFRNSSVETVILPLTIETIAENAFAGAQLRELYLYDNVSYVTDEAFSGCTSFHTVHINAILAPRFGQNLYSEYNFADKYDLLILNKDRKKLILYGGSGVYNSIDALSVEKALAQAGEDYFCINMAVNGWFNGAAQFDMIAPYLRQGDVFLHAPETSSNYSVLYDVTMTPWGAGFDYNKLRMDYCVESNYDLFSLVDLQHVTEFFDGFNAFNAERADMEPTSYTDYKTEVSWYGETFTRDFAYMDERGTIALPKYTGANRSAGEADVVVEYLTNAAANARLNAVYDAMREKGVTVLFSNAPINADTLRRRLTDPASFDRASDDGVLYYGRPPGVGYPQYDSLEEWISIYEETVKERLHCAVLLPLSETLFVTGDYFEPDYHLSDEATPIFTDRIAQALVKYLSENKGL